MRIALAPLLVLALAQDRAEEPEIHPEPALVCVDRKVASGEQIGLYRRDRDGRMEKIWDGEAYDALWRLDKTIYVTERWQGRVSHIDLDGKLLWRIGGFERPVDVELDEHGVVCVLDNDANTVVGIDRETQRKLWTRTGLNDPFDMLCLPGGGLLVADSGAHRIVRLDEHGEQVQEIRDLGFVNSVDLLEDGGFLATNWSDGEVMEFDAAGKLLWKTYLGGTLFSAQRRPDGITVVSEGSRGRIYYLDQRGRVKKVEDFSPGCVDYETIVEL
jgi:outer membrane protein assembly factor BamB